MYLTFVVGGGCWVTYARLNGYGTILRWSLVLESDSPLSAGSEPCHLVYVSSHPRAMAAIAVNSTAADPPDGLLSGVLAAITKSTIASQAYAWRDYSPAAS